MSDLYVQTASGRRVYLNEPARGISIGDAANQLSKINRFNGATQVPYSVAQHSVWVTKRIRDAGHGPVTQMAGLLHDVPEYILGDMARPVQWFLWGKPDRSLHIPGPWEDAHNAIMEGVLEALNMPRDWPPGTYEIVKHFDNMALRTEWRDLMTGPEPDNFKGLPDCHPWQIVPFVHWRIAERDFLHEFEKLQHLAAVEALR